MPDWCKTRFISSYNTITHPSFTVIQVSFVLRMYSDTEGVGLRFVEVCVQVVLGTIDKNGAAVNVWTVNQTATGKYYYTAFIVHRSTSVASSSGHLVHNQSYTQWNSSISTP